MNPILQILLSAGGATVIAAIINAVMNRRKLGAEATEIITKAAGLQVENVMKDNTELRTKVARLEKTVDQHEHTIEVAERRERHHLIEDERWRWHMQRWHDWGETVSTLLESCTNRPPPPTPPSWPEPLETEKRQ